MNNLSTIPTSDAIEDVSRLVADLGKTAMGDGELQSGPNKGQQRLLRDASDWAVPKGVREAMYLEMPSLGFGTYIQKDWTPKDLVERLMGKDSDYEHFNTLVKDARADMKEKLLEKYLELYPENPEEVEKEVQKMVNKRHPSIKSYFKDSGQMYAGAAGLLRQYDEEYESRE
jgi:hypothetical protein